MRKLYIDIAIAVVSIYLILKHTLFFLTIVGILAGVWFFAFDDKKRKEIKDRIAEFYR